MGRRFVPQSTIDRRVQAKDDRINAETQARTLGQYYRTCGTPKPEAGCVTKRRNEKLEAKNERACREITRKRDLGKCRVPGCIERAHHLHHITYRSASSKRKWATGNCVWLCTDHHRLEHAHEISISGDADGELEITGNIDLLTFRL